jgi:MFS family permease
MVLWVKLRRLKIIPRGLGKTVWLLSFISLFTDLASEMLYPVLPVYLSGIGYSIVFIGVLEGLAEAMAGLSKSYFGTLRDRLGERKTFISAGYGLSAISKPLMIASTLPLWIFLTRLADRLGKGIRTGARDALLSDAATPATKGRVFGFHRSMDTAGAFAGPLIALLLLHFFPGNYALVFYAAAIPGIASLCITRFLREPVKEKTVQSAKKPDGFFTSLSYIGKSPFAYRKLTGVLLLFALFNSADMFLLLRIREAGVSDSGVIGCYIFYNAVYALAAFPFGKLADRSGMVRMLAAGLIFYALTYGGFALATASWVFPVLLFFYGLYAAATEGIAKALISNLVPKGETARAIGTFSALQSIALLIASSMAGICWHYAGPKLTFLLPATTALICSVLLAKMIGIRNPEGMP